MILHLGTRYSPHSQQLFASIRVLPSRSQIYLSYLVCLKPETTFNKCLTPVRPVPGPLCKARFIRISLELRGPPQPPSQKLQLLLARPSHQPAPPTCQISVLTTEFLSYAVLTTPILALLTSIISVLQFFLRITSQNNSH